MSAEPETDNQTTSHRLVLPADANHHGTLYAGSLLRFALEAAYATACRAVGPEANMMLRRVLTIECRRAVPVGRLVEIRGTVLQVKQCHLVVGVVGMPLEGQGIPWMDGLLGFVHVDEACQPITLPREIIPVADSPLWRPLASRLEKLAAIRGATADWLDPG
jgi:acyl-CoA thioesterase YciA